MEYKEKYEMALETIREILDSGSDSIKMSRLRLRLQSVFFELKESEDEKACDAYCKVCGHYPHTVPTHICRKNCDYFLDFKNYMKGG